MKAFVLASTLFVLASSAQAATTVFADNFDANGGGLDAVPAGWTVSGGTVDIIGAGTGFDYVPNSGKFIDLDGTTYSAGTLSVALNLTAGQQYSASFDLAGNHVNSSLESVTASFGTSSGAYSLTRDAGWTGYTLSFTPTTSGLYTLSFKNAGGDNVGMLLDNVKVAAAVPEPETYAMLLAGLGVLTVATRCRRAV